MESKKAGRLEKDGQDVLVSELRGMLLDRSIEDSHEGILSTRQVRAEDVPIFLVLALANMCESATFQAPYLGG